DGVGHRAARNCGGDTVGLGDREVGRQHPAGGDRDVVDGGTAEADRGVAIQVEHELRLKPSETVHTALDQTPPCTGADVHGRVPGRIGHGGVEVLEQACRIGWVAYLAQVDVVVVEARALHLVAMRPPHQHRGDVG